MSDNRKPRKKVGKYKIKEKNIVNLNKFYEKIKKEWRRTQ